MKTYSDTLDTANRLPHWVHWLLGTLVSWLAMALENAAVFSQFGWVFIALFGAFAGLIFSVPSRLVMGIFPWPYAWLAHKFGA